MRRISVVITAMAMALSSAGFAGETYDVDWPALKSAFHAFLEQPNKERAETITVQLLPPGKRASHKVESFNAQIAEEVLSQSARLDDLVKAGNVYALGVAFALTEISDGEYSSWLDVITSSAIEEHPREYLIGVMRRWVSRPSACVGSAVLHWEFEGDHVQVLNARRIAIESVTDKHLEIAKICVTDALSMYSREAEPLQ